VDIQRLGCFDDGVKAFSKRSIGGQAVAAERVLIAGEWRASQGTTTFQAENPGTRQPLPHVYPVSPWSEIEGAIVAADAAWKTVRHWPGSRFAAFLEQYASGIEARAADLIAAANAETALPVEPRLARAELPRTVNQLRQAAAAARSEVWRDPVIDAAANIRSQFASIGPVVVFGPNNFPFAFNGISGGDFAAAAAAGNPVIAKGHSSHPRTTQLFAEAAQAAATATDMPPGFVQLLYRTSHADGERLVSHRLVGATGYTGARNTGLVLKAAADRVGKPIYLELSSINPVALLPGAIAERSAALAEEFCGSCLMGTGQFCTNPGLVLMIAGQATESFIDIVAGRFTAAAPGTLLSEGVLRHLQQGVASITQAGARVLVGGGENASSAGYSMQNTLLRVSGEVFLGNAEKLQTEAFGNCSLFVVCANETELLDCLDQLEGNLTGSIYSSAEGRDDAFAESVADRLRPKVGRLLNDKMPTGVAVSPAMNHGGPFPATGHPTFTAVGIPASIRRFTRLECYDGVRPDRLPPALQNRNPTGQLQRFVGGVWTVADVPENG
jgi:NADP-dependent aldehyde dehydrogenase